jgi:hypothetical protein
MTDRLEAQTTSAAEEGDRTSTPVTIEPQDFYVQNGLVVFTAAYHLKRGFCCNSGCRHCPYR